MNFFTILSGTDFVISDCTCENLIRRLELICHEIVKHDHIAS